MMEFFDEQGKPAATVSFELLKTLAPLTNDPAATLEKLGIDDKNLVAALQKLGTLANSK